MPTPGVRRAGQDRAAPEGSLDVPKRSRDNPKPERPGSLRDVDPYERHRHAAQHRCRGWISAATCVPFARLRTAVYAGSSRVVRPPVGTPFCPDRQLLPPHRLEVRKQDEIVAQFGPGLSHDLRPDHHDKRAARRHRHPGRERPRGAGRGRLRAPRAGSLTPRLPLPHRGPGMNGRHSPPYAGDARSGNIWLHKRLQRWTAGAVASRRSRIEVTRKVGSSHPPL
jgi:hypothetical protein